MTEHYARGTTEATSWCARCRRTTLHRVDHPVPPAQGGGRVGPCIDPKHPQLGLSREQQKRRDLAEKKRRQPSLFEAK